MKKLISVAVCFLLCMIAAVSLAGCELWDKIAGGLGISQTEETTRPSEEITTNPPSEAPSEEPTQQPTEPPQQIYYTVSYDFNDGSGRVEERSVPSGGVAEAYAPYEEKELMQLVGWSTVPNADWGQSIPVYSDMYVYAVWQKYTCNITFNYNDGSGTVINKIVDKGSNFSDVALYSNVGDRRIVGWSVTVNGQAYSGTVMNDMVVYAIWEFTEYTYQGQIPASMTHEYCLIDGRRSNLVFQHGYLYVGANVRRLKLYGDAGTEYTLRVEIESRQTDLTIILYNFNINATEKEALYGGADESNYTLYMEIAGESSFKGKDGAAAMKVGNLNLYSYNGGMLRLYGSDGVRGADGAPVGEGKHGNPGETGTAGSSALQVNNLDVRQCTLYAQGGNGGAGGNGSGGNNTDGLSFTGKNRDGGNGGSGGKGGVGIEANYVSTDGAVIYAQGGAGGAGGRGGNAGGRSNTFAGDAGDGGSGGNGGDAFSSNAIVSKYNTTLSAVGGEGGYGGDPGSTHKESNRGSKGSNGKVGSSYYNEE